MLEEVALPFDLQRLRSPFLPFADDGLNALTDVRKCQYQMDVIWHKECEMRVPDTSRMSVLNGLQ